MSRPLSRLQRSLLMLGIVACALMAISIVIPVEYAPPTSSPSRALSDLRTMQTALETYYLDWKAYPPTETKGVPLTTPVQYLTMLIPDLCSPEDEPRPYGYFSAHNNWLVYSRGPDKDFDLDPTAEFLSPDDDTPLIPYTYDPTNGVGSSGDLWRKGNPDIYPR